jgi:hypothetical protein
MQTTNLSLLGIIMTRGEEQNCVSHRNTYVRDAAVLLYALSLRGIVTSLKKLQVDRTSLTSTSGTS